MIGAVRVPIGFPTAIRKSAFTSTVEHISFAASVWRQSGIVSPAKASKTLLYENAFEKPLTWASRTTCWWNRVNVWIEWQCQLDMIVRPVPKFRLSVPLI